MLDSVSKVPQEIFRAYDIRGIVDKTLTVDGAELIGRAIGSEIRKTGERSVVVGRDGRLSGAALQEALTKGLCATGCSVVSIGCVPTPLLYFATYALGIGSGIMITGSHNPMDYNGFKILINGKAIYGETISRLYDRIQTQSFYEDKGQQATSDVQQDYIQSVCDRVSLPHSLKIVVDCGNGVAGHIAPQLYTALGCEVIPLFCEVDGRFPNHHPDPGQPKNLQDLIQAVRTHQADVGLAFDGDGDRLGVVDASGKIIWPDRQLILFSQDVVQRHPGATILFDVKCSRHVKESLQLMGADPVMWKTGHSLIKAKMQETGALLAGEMSGHIFFKDGWFGFDDGLYVGARLLEILAHKKPKQDSSEVFSEIPESYTTPELVLPSSEGDKFKIIKQLVALAQFPGATVSTIDGLRVDFEDGFGLARCSNTGPNIILRFEGDTPAALERIQNQFREMFHTLNASLTLPF